EAWYISSLCQVAEQRPVWIMRPTPVMPADISSVMGREKLINRDMNLSLPRKKYDERNAYIWDLQDKAALQCGIHILDPIEILCDATRCIAEHSGLPIYRDDDHLSEYGNRLLEPMFKSMLEHWPR